MACAGEGYHVHVTGLTHDEQGYPVITAPAHERLVRRLVDKIRLNAQQIIQVEEVALADAEAVVMAYGCTSRAAREAVNPAQKPGEKDRTPAPDHPLAFSGRTGAPISRAGQGP